MPDAAANNDAASGGHDPHARRQAMVQLLISVALGCTLVYFLYFNHGMPGQLVSIALLLYGFLAPVYLLVRLGIERFRYKKTMQDAADGKTPSSSAGPNLVHLALEHREGVRWQRLFQRLLHLKPWKPALCSAVILLFAFCTQHWRQNPKDLQNITGFGAWIALVLWVIIGFELLHHFWEWLHPRLFKHYVPKLKPEPNGNLSTVQKTLYIVLLASSCFAMVELLLSPGQAVTVIFAFLAPGIMLLFLYGFGFMLSLIWTALKKSSSPAQ